MRKIDPSDVRADFEKLLRTVEEFYDAAVLVVPTQKDRTLLAENTLLTCAVLWEGFISDLFIAYINRDSQRFRKHLRDSLETQLSESAKAKSIYDKFCSLKMPKHMTKADIQELADARGNNITFPNYKAIEDKAKQWLSKSHSDRITKIKSPQKATINAWIAIRNHIAHRSQSSLDRMNDALAVGGLTKMNLKRGNNRVQHIGAYLKAKPVVGGESRLKRFMASMRTIAAAI